MSIVNSPLSIGVHVVMEEELAEVRVAGGSLLGGAEEEVAYGLDGGCDFNLQDNLADVEGLHERDGRRDGPQDAVAQERAELLGVDASQVVHQHVAIVSAIKLHIPALARQSMADHIRSSLNFVAYCDDKGDPFAIFKRVPEKPKKEKADT